jgi:hypothetical protein
VDDGGSELIERLVAELHDVLDACGLPAPDAPNDVLVLDEIDQALSPARLPEAVRRLWELIDPSSLQALVSFYPSLSPPDFALTSWRMDEENEFIGGPPRHLFPVCYESHETISVECDGPNWSGGGLFEWFISDPGATLTLRYRSIEDWLSVLVGALRAGLFTRVGDAHLMIDVETGRQLAESKIAEHPLPLEYRGERAINLDPGSWPAIWHERSRPSP